MKPVAALSLALAILVVGTSTWAAQDDQQPSQHPPGMTGTAPASPASHAMPGMPSHDMTGMDAQMQAMTDMHNKMTAAKTPSERDALMAEHTKTMQDGMDMMKGMSPVGMGDMGGMKGDKATHDQMMEKRMQMMQSMMQMMIDRLPPTPTK